MVTVGDEPVGGLVRAASRLTNLLGATNLSGDAFARTMETQITELGVPVRSGRVVSLVRCDQGFEAVLTDRQIIRAKTVCLATGTRPAYWSLGETLRGVHRDARSLPGDLTGAVVAIIGGGEAAVDTALSVVGRGGRALILARSERLRATAPLMLRARNLGVEKRSSTTITKFSGGPGAWMLADAAGNEIPAEVLVVCIGRVPCEELIDGLGIQLSSYSVAKTGIPGLWLAGDVLRSHDRYVALAMADGQQAALYAGRYVRGGK